MGLSYPHSQCQIKSFARLLGSHKKRSTVYYVGTVVIGYTLQWFSAQVPSTPLQSLSKLVKPITVISGHADGLKNSCTSFLYSSSPVRNNLVLRKRRNFRSCIIYDAINLVFEGYKSTDCLGHPTVYTPYPCSSLVNLLSLTAVTAEGKCQQAPSLDLPCHSLNRFLVDVPQHHFRAQLCKPAHNHTLLLIYTMYIYYAYTICIHN